MDEFTRPKDIFHEAINRGRELTGLYEFLSKNFTAVLNADDCLRAAVVQTVSSFDHLMHEAFCAGVTKRLRDGANVQGLEVPFSFLGIDGEDREKSIVQFVRKSISHKTFVDPDKMATALKHFDPHPWNRLSPALGMEVSTIKFKQKQIYRWRNRIAHEADINPSNAGVELFPIDKDDVLDAIRFFEALGNAVVAFYRAA